ATGELKRGDGVFVMGRLVNDSWTDKEGNRRFTTRLEGQRVEFLTRGPGSGGAGTRPERQATGAQARTSTLDIDEEFPPEEDLPFVRRESRRKQAELDIDDEFPPEEDLPF